MILGIDSPSCSYMSSLYDDFIYGHGSMFSDEPSNIPDRTVIYSIENVNRYIGDGAKSPKIDNEEIVDVFTQQRMLKKRELTAEEMAKLVRETIIK